MTTYAGNIAPLLPGLASCADQQNQTFTKEYLNPGYVKYYDYATEIKTVTHPQRLDDFYGTLKSLGVGISSSWDDKTKKAALQMALDQYHAKQPSARSYLVLAMSNGKPQISGQNAVAWFDQTQPILENLIQNVQNKMNTWKV